MTFADQLHTLQVRNGHTAAEAAEVFGMSARTWSGWVSAEEARWPHEIYRAAVLEFYQRHAKPVKRSGKVPGRPLKRRR